MAVLLKLASAGEALGMRFTLRSCVAAVGYGSAGAGPVLVAMSADGKLTGLDWFAVSLAFVFTAAAAFTRTKLPDSPNDPTK
jgi:hypothetical protein